MRTHTVSQEGVFLVPLSTPGPTAQESIVNYPVNARTLDYVYKTTKFINEFSSRFEFQK